MSERKNELLIWTGFLATTGAFGVFTGLHIFYNLFTDDAGFYFMAICIFYAIGIGLYHIRQYMKSNKEVS